jgi:GrpB-like predicted nucleotidyltransferase (UPF0157 family)
MTDPAKHESLPTSEERLHKINTDINLHCFSDGCPEIERMLVFRDWLRSHENDRLLYDRAKRELAAQTWKYVQNYADAKTAIVEDILRRARTSCSEGLKA